MQKCVIFLAILCPIFPSFFFLFFLKDFASFYAPILTEGEQPIAVCEKCMFAPNQSNPFSLLDSVNLCGCARL